MSFLKAEWRKLILVNYCVSPELLKKYIPKGTELDLWNGKCYVSLVGFLFRNTKVLGLKIPGHINFEEVNLRFYVKRDVEGEIRRGVVFIKEIVPKTMITFVANTVYNENYVTRKMKHVEEESDEELKIGYSWLENKELQHFEVLAESKAIEFQRDSEEEFITEHYWGYASSGKNATNEYEVTHPKWEVYPVKKYDVRVNFEKVYGKDFKILDNMDASSVFLAEGSIITVESKNTIK